MRIRYFAYAISLIFFSVFLFVSCQRTDKVDEKNSVYASLIDSTKYIGKEACKQCHSDKFETFMHTGMGLSFDSATHSKSSSRFTTHDIIYDKDKNFSYYPHWEGSDLILTEFRLNGKDTVYLRKEKINYIVGSGQHTNSHMIDRNGYIYQAPATFYTQSGKWDLPPGFENGYNNRFSRLIELECMSCHNAYPEMVLGSANKYINVPSGIDCERCHGPGSTHQKLMVAGELTDIKSAIDYSIVNPAKLPIALQLDVCQRCHIQGNAVLMKGKSFFDFKPAMHLSQVMNVFMPVFKGDDDQHIMASHAERMKMSECFNASLKIVDEYNKTHPTLEPYKNALTCITCHNPHVSVKETNKEVFNDACKSCHATSIDLTTQKTQSIITGQDCSASKETRMAKNDNCVSCHMPRSGTIDIPHVTTTDHWIRKPVSQSGKAKIREFVKLVCINNPDVDDRSKGVAYLSYFEKFVSKPEFLDSAKMYLSDNSTSDLFNNFNELIRWAFLKDDFNSVINYVSRHGHSLDSLQHKSFSSDDAWTAYRIGQSFKLRGDKISAEVYFSRAVELAPYYPDFRIKLADLEYELSEFDKAKKNYEFILKENPNFVSAYINLGFLELTRNNNEQLALAHYQKALQLDPDNVQALLNMAGLMYYKQEFGLAKGYLNKVLKIDPLNSQAKKLLNLPK